MDKNSAVLKRIKTYFLMPLLILGGGMMVGYQIKTLWKNAQQVSHDSAIPWQLLGEAYRMRLQPDSLLYADSLQQIERLDGHQIVLYGYMNPTMPGDTHTRFLLNPRTHSCAFCIPGNPGNIVDVTMDDAITFQREPVLLKGTLAIGDAKSGELMYNLNDAEKVD
jgi:uncharacterized protein